MTVQLEQLLKPEQIQSALEVMHAYLTAPKNPDGRTPMKVQKERDDQRILLIENELKPLLQKYLSGLSNLAEFKTTVDGINKRNEFWGFKGIKGQMFFNMVVNVAQDSAKCDQEIKTAIKVPTTEHFASSQIKAFCDYVNRIGDDCVRSGGTKAERPKLGSVPFFLSYFWQIQEPEAWPVFYTNSVNVMHRLWIYSYGRLCIGWSRFRSIFHSSQDGVALLGLVSMFYPIRLLPGHRCGRRLCHRQLDSWDHGPPAQRHDLDGPTH